MDEFSQIEKALEELRKATGLSLSLDTDPADLPEDAAGRLSMLTAAWREKYDRSSFFRHLLYGTISEADLYAAASRFHIPEYRPRQLYVIELRSDKAEEAARVLRQMFELRSGDQFSVLDDRRIILVKSLTDRDSEESALSDAHTMIDMLSMEAMISARVGLSAPLEALRDMPAAFRNAMLSLKIGSIFYSSETVLQYSRLGIGRLVHDLTDDACRLFLREIFGEAHLDDFDDETVGIINAFFENNLNISETARQLYVHRNTLVYRLEKLHQATGLDLRIFDDAVALKLAMMISDCMRYREKNGELRGSVRRRMSPAGPD